MNKLKLYIVVLLTLIAVNKGFCGDWVVETVVSSDDIYGSSIALDSNDYPYISFGENDNDDLMLARWSGSAWQIEAVDTVGRLSSGKIAIDSIDNPHISYYDWDNDDLKYAYWNGSDWEITRFDIGGNNGRSNSIALDSSDNPHISYYDTTTATLRYIWWDGSTWDRTTVDTIYNTGLTNSIAIDAGDYPHITYYDKENYGLKNARWDNGNWEISTIDSGGFYTGYSNSIALDSENHEHISYQLNSSHQLSYAKYESTGWEISYIDVMYYYGETSIALDSDDYPHISYYTETPDDALKYAYWNGDEWKIEIIDQGYNMGESNSIALNSAGFPRISYVDGSPDDLKYAYYKSAAPYPFNLLSPADGEGVYGPLTLDWEDSGTDFGSLEYSLWYSTENDFDPYEEVTGLTNSEYTFPVGTLDDGETYYWKVRAVSGYEETWSGPDGYWSFDFITNGIDDIDSDIPTVFALGSPVPNPSNGTATISFALPRTSEVNIGLYDIKGRKISTLAEGQYQPGEYQTDITGLSGGLYFYRLIAEEFSDVKKIVVK